ncbi:ROK family protein [Microbacterium sp. W4I20]|uniref:ROK family protein n=1 Tax=Microbacterium sp. W4I20 TaxID=3042262 RepID=UPI0027D86352|nr:ROK family protein [Microbacterium sp. W4I20]
MIEKRVTTADAAERAAVRVLDVGGSHATAASVVLDAEGGGAVRDADAVPLDPAASADALLDAIAAPAVRLGSLPGADDGAAHVGWVVAMPGPFDYAAGVGRFDAVGKFEALRGVSIREGLASRLGVDGDSIRFVNDAAAYGVGEWAFGSSTRADRHVCITLGTGVGSSFLDRGRVVDDGAEVPSNGWAYLLEFDGRPLEDTVSTRAIVAEFARRTGRTASVKEIAADAAGGDPVAAEVLDRAMAALGATLAPWLHSFRATRLTIGGSMARSWPVLVTGLTRGIAEGMPGGRAPASLEILPSTLLDDAPILGAAHWLHSPDSSLDSSPDSAPDSLRSDHR